MDHVKVPILKTLNSSWKNRRVSFIALIVVNLHAKYEPFLRKIIYQLPTNYGSDSMGPERYAQVQKCSCLVIFQPILHYAIHHLLPYPTPQRVDS